MEASTVVLLIMLVLAAVLAFVMRESSAEDPPPPDTTADTDAAELEAAEDEVRNLDAFASPSDAEEDLHDWGPGAPKP